MKLVAASLFCIAISLAVGQRLIIEERGYDGKGCDEETRLWTARGLHRNKSTPCAETKCIWDSANLHWKRVVCVARLEEKYEGILPDLPLANVKEFSGNDCMASSFSGEIMAPVRNRCYRNSANSSMLFDCESKIWGIYSDRNCTRMLGALPMDNKCRLIGDRWYRGICSESLKPLLPSSSNARSFLYSINFFVCAIVVLVVI